MLKKEVWDALKRELECLLILGTERERFGPILARIGFSCIPSMRLEVLQYLLKKTPKDKDSRFFVRQEDIIKDLRYSKTTMFFTLHLKLVLLLDQHYKHTLFQTLKEM